MPSDPLARLSWKPPKASEAVDRRVAVNPRQTRELLTAVTYVGQQRCGPYARGQRLMAFYACMCFAALRPAEVVGLRRQDCHLPATGWGRLTLEKSRPEVNRRWTDTDPAHDERGLKHRATDETRRVPIPPELVGILRTHIDTFGIASDGRIFSSDRGRPIASTAISDVWAEARTLARSHRLWPLVPTTCATQPFLFGWRPEFPRPGSLSGPGTASKSCCASTPSAAMTARTSPTPALTPLCEMPDVIPCDRTGPREPMANQAGHRSDRRRAIPRISHDQRHTTASGGIWLHGPETNQGRRIVPELGFPLVAGVGFEPT